AAIFAVLVPGSAAYDVFPPIEPLPIASYSPTNGAVIPVRPAGYGESSWSLTSIPRLEQVWVVVSRTPATGTDGIRLSDTDRFQICVLNPSGTNEGFYQGRCRTENGGQTVGTSAEWTTVPGTYYWQIWANYFEVISKPYPEAPEFIHRKYVSQIFT